MGVSPLQFFMHERNHVGLGCCIMNHFTRTHRRGFQERRTGKCKCEDPLNFRLAFDARVKDGHSDVSLFGTRQRCSPENWLGEATTACGLR